MLSRIFERSISIRDSAILVVNKVEEVLNPILAKEPESTLKVEKELYELLAPNTVDSVVTCSSTLQINKLSIRKLTPSPSHTTFI